MLSMCKYLWDIESNHNKRNLPLLIEIIKTFKHVFMCIILLN